jgi:hypothetical protein
VRAAEGPQGPGRPGRLQRLGSRRRGTLAPSGHPEVLLGAHRPRVAELPPASASPPSSGSGRSTVSTAGTTDDPSGSTEDAQDPQDSPAARPSWKGKALDEMTSEERAYWRRSRRTPPDKRLAGPGETLVSFGEPSA